MSDYYSELGEHSNPACHDGWRHRLEQWLRFEVILRGLGVGESADIVDLGCGTAQLCSYLGDEYQGNYVGVDLFEPSILRARERCPGAKFICGDLFRREVEEAGPFEFAVAIGTMVSGEESQGVRVERLKRLISRLQRLGTKGWALVVLNQEVLEEDPIRSLETCLQGASPSEIEHALQSSSSTVFIEDQALPTDLFVISCEDRPPGRIEKAIQGDGAHHTVLQRHLASGEGDDSDAAWFWWMAGRAENAQRELESISDGNPRKAILAERLGAMK